MDKQTKEARRRDRMIEKSREFQTSTYIRRFVAPEFQKMIRAEAAVKPRGYESAIIDGSIDAVYREIGQCVCVTCGKVGPWKGNAVGGGTIETGHFIASRRNAIVFEETNVHPQCKYCNRHLSGNQANYEMWMQFKFGQDEIDRLRRLKATTVQFTREELVDMRLTFAERLKAAEEVIA